MPSATDNMPSSHHQSEAPAAAALPSVSILIYAHNEKEALNRCLVSIQQTNQMLRHEILIIDDASKDGTAALVQDQFPQVTLVQNKSARGQVRSINQLLEKATGSYVLLLDARTTLQPHTLEQLTGILGKNPEAGIVGPRLAAPSGETLDICRSFPTITTSFPKFLQRVFFKQPASSPAQAGISKAGNSMEVEFVPWLCLLIRRETLSEVGWLDERISEGPVDADFCMRARSHGWKILYDPQQTVYLDSIERKSARMRFKKIWSAFYFFQKHSYLWRAESRDHAIIMPRAIEQFLLFSSDFIAIIGSYLLWSKIRGMLGFFTIATLPELLMTGFWIFCYWFLVFMFFGLYRTWYAYSRIDEVISIFKAVFFGVLLIFALTFEISDLSTPSTSRLLIVSYWVLMTLAVATGRGSLRTLQRRMLESGIGLRRTLIVGWNKKARSLYDKIQRFPALGYRVVGFVETSSPTDRQSHDGVPVIGSVSHLGQIVLRENIEEILIALSWKQRKFVMAVISQCAEKDVKLNIIPDLYGTVVGRARTNQIYGVPLIEILPEHMAPWEKKTKRLLDILVSAAVILIGLPFWLLVALIIKIDSRGPVLYSQERVGMKNRHYRMFKFRSMVQDAEKRSGPKWADKDDPRITKIGKWLRKTRIDEIPQFWNVLKGEMSLVGPRPERPYFVEKLRKEVPLYSRRLRVRPGISGWAQIKGDYDASLDTVKQKLQYDIFYLENMSLRLDFKILLMTLYVVLRGRGQ